MARLVPEEVRMLSRDEKDDRSVEITQVMFHTERNIKIGCM